MGLQTMFLLIVAILGFWGNLGVMADCTDSIPTTNGCTLTFTPFITPQIAPTTTYYREILTTHYYVVDCDFCTVTNALNHNPTVSGPFNVAVTVDVLTISRVACIPSGSATTRGVEATTTSALLAGGQNKVDLVVSPEDDSIVLGAAPLVHLTRRSEDGDLADLALSFGNDFPPDTRQLPGHAQELMTSILSAMFALNVADSGLNATWACREVQTSEVKYQLKESWLDPDQVKAILCWIADHGYNFNTTRAELYSTLQAAVYALQVAGGFTHNRTEICENLDLFYRVGGYLGINTKGFEEYACRNIPSDTPSPSGYYGPTPVIPLIPYPVNSTTSWGHPTPWNPNVTIWPTGAPSATHPIASNHTSGPTGYSNSSHATGTGHPTGTGNWTSLLPTGTGGTGNTTYASPSVTGWSTSTISGTAASSNHPDTTSTLNGSSPIHVPLDPNAKAFYPAVKPADEEERRGWFKRY